MNELALLNGLSPLFLFLLLLICAIYINNVDSYNYSEILNPILVNANGLSRNYRQVGQIRNCDFDCIHGTCDPVTRNCICNEGWKGGACDICAEGHLCDWSAMRPRLSLILPQTGSDSKTRSENNFVYAHGRGFPRGRNGRYNCLFGGMTTLGKWLSNAVVQCERPPKAHIGKHVFNLVPFASNAYIPFDTGTTHHFTFYASCDESTCQSACLGPLCLCSHSRSGQYCEISNLEASLRSVSTLENDPSKITAIEFQYFTAKLSVQSESSKLTLASSEIPEIIIDPFEYSAIWYKPIGRNPKNPYVTTIEIDDCNSKVLLKWSLFVVPTFAPILKDIVVCNNDVITNQMFLRGKIRSIQQNNGSEKFNFSDSPLLLNGDRIVPLKLLISNNATHELIEIIDVEMEIKNLEAFRFPIFFYYPMIPLYIRAQHVGLQDEDFETGVLKNWLHLDEEQFQVNYVKGHLMIDSELTLQYSITKITECSNETSKWEIELLEPRDKLSIHSIEITDRHIQVKFQKISEIYQDSLLKLVFKCLRHSATTHQAIEPLHIPDQIIRFSPLVLDIDEPTGNTGTEIIPVDLQIKHATLDVDMDVLKNLTCFPPFRLVYGDLSSLHKMGVPTRIWLALEVDKITNTADYIHIPSQFQPLISIPYRIQGAKYRKDEIEFTLILKCLTDNRVYDGYNALIDVELYSTNRKQHFMKSVYLNTPTIFSPLYTEIFQLKIQSIDFLPCSFIMRITPNNNTLTVELERVSAQQLVLDDTKLDFFNVNEPNKHKRNDNNPKNSAPILSIKPSVFGLSEIEDTKRIFVNIIYESGPLDSFATIIDKKIDTKENSLFIVTIDLEEIPALCLGCGYRVPLKIYKNYTHLQNGDYCNIYSVDIPFLYTIPNITRRFESKTRVIVDIRSEKNIVKPILCTSSNVPNLHTITTKTQLSVSCPTTKLLKCRALYQPATICDKYWRNIPDDLISIHTFAQFLLLAANCRISGIDLSTLRAFLRCVITVDIDCPTSFPNNVNKPLINPNLNNGDIFNKFMPFKLGIQTMFPALSAVETQLINFPQLLYDFLAQLEDVFATADFSEITGRNNSNWLDNFLQVISDQSMEGAKITQSELSNFNEWEKGSTLISQWNKMFDDLSGENLDLQFPQLKPNLREFKELINRADRLKAITRQFGGENPFAMLHDVMHKIFSSLKHQNSNEIIKLDDILAEAFVRIEPTQIQEGEEFQIFVTITNIKKGTEIRNFRINLELGHDYIDLNGQLENIIKYRLGPIFYSGISSLDENNLLRTNSTLEVRWTALSIPEFRLTQTIKQSPQIVISFEYNDFRKIQRINCPTLTIVPKSSLRILALAFPAIYQQNFRSNPHKYSVNFAIINTGYSTLRNVRLINIRASIFSATDSDDESIRINFKFTGIQLNNDHFHALNDWNVGDIKSREYHHLTLNISTAKETSGLIKNLSVLATANEVLLPHLDYRFFFIQNVVANGNFDRLLVSESHLPYPLYFYNKKDSKLTPVDTLQLVQKKIFTQDIDNHKLDSIFVVYNPIQVSENKLRASAKGSAPKKVAVYGSLSVDVEKYFKNGNPLSELIRISEVVNDGRTFQRQVDKNNIWLESDSIDAKEKTIKFIDLHATLQNSQIFYEFLFGDPKFFQKPYFPQESYSIQILPAAFETLKLHKNSSAEDESKSVVFARIQAISPLNSPLNYTLISTNLESQIEIVPETGEIVLNGNASLDPTSLNNYCTNILVSDIEGRRVIVPVQFNTLLKNNIERSCKVFPNTATTYRHEFYGDQSVLERITYKKTQEIASLPFSSTTSMESDPLLAIHYTTVEAENLESSTTKKLELITPYPEPAINIVPLTDASIPEADEEEQEKNSENDDRKVEIESTISSIKGPQVLEVTKPPVDIVTPHPIFSTVVPTKGSLITLLPYSSENEETKENADNSASPPKVIDSKPISFLEPFTMATFTLATLKSNGPVPSENNYYTEAPPNSDKNPVYQVLPDKSLHLATLNSATPATIRPEPVISHTVKVAASPLETSTMPFKYQTTEYYILYDEKNSVEMISMACRKRNEKPIWAIICDLTKTVYKVVNK